jgi:hypothetical protein
MDTHQLSLYALWAVLVLNLAVTLRLTAWTRVLTGMRNAAAVTPTELRIGSTAPTFRALSLDGELVSEQTFAGREVVFVFLSPDCGGCRERLPMLQHVGTAAGAAGVAVVLVLDVGRTRARGWLDAVAHEDGLRVTLPVLVAPPSQYPLVPAYTAGYFPYFCVLDSGATVQARGVVGMDRPEWREVVARWIPPPDPQALGRPAAAGRPATAG